MRSIEAAPLEFVKAHLRLPDELASEDMFVPGAVISEFLLDEIDATLRSSRSGRLSVWLTHAPDPAATVAACTPNFSSGPIRGDELCRPAAGLHQKVGRR